MTENLAGGALTARSEAWLLKLARDYILRFKVQDENRLLF